MYIMHRFFIQKNNVNKTRQMNEANQVEIIYAEIGRRNDKIIREIRLYHFQAIS